MKSTQIVMAPPTPIRSRRWLALGLGIALLFPRADAAEMSLLKLANQAEMKQVSATGASVAWSQVAGRPGLRVMTGHTVPWPGVTLRAPSPAWDLSGFGQVAVRLKNTSPGPLTLNCRVDNDGADGRVNCITGSLALTAGEEGVLRVLLKRTSDDTLDGKLFGMRGYPVRAGGPGTVDPKRITQILVFLNQPTADHSFEILGLHADGTVISPTAGSADATPFFPFIDTFGQYHHRDWPGKVKSEADLKSRREAEAKALAASPGPANWSKFGGSATGPKQRATGYFRTEKVAGKWWFVDPEGHLFFSHGIDCVRMLDATPIEERESWFADFPGAEPGFAQLRSRGFALKGHYAGRNPECFSFAAANLMRKYGPNWTTEYPTVIQQRLRGWGLNTIANWSDERTFLKRQTAYTDNIGSHGSKQIEGSEGYWGKFPDVFDPSFHESLRRAMQAKQGKSAGDPWCLGYFSDNEMSWGDETSLALAALKSPPTQAAKIAFIADLKTKYGEVGKLNAAWGTGHASWEELASNREAPAMAKARPDLTAFYRRAAGAYFKGVKDAIESVAPNQLYLGCRFSAVNPVAAAEAAKHCDVVSYNLYQRSVAGFQCNGGADVPLIIGEFHFGALDRGLFHTGLVPVENQQARAEAYQNYVLGALQHPQFVGCHWFQYQDEPTTGRVYDEENYQIGFVDIADTPYPEIIAASRRVGEQLYAP
jgi:hypothetical protein